MKSALRALRYSWRRATPKCATPKLSSGYEVCDFIQYNAIASVPGHRPLKAAARSACDEMDPRVTELHCIMPIGNIPSVLARGILSHEAATKLRHHSVAMQPIQDKRDKKTVHGGLRLHQYANLYFHARNPMLSVRRHEDICVLRISASVLNLPGIVITDENAASNYVRFFGLAQWRSLDFDDIYARDWTHPNDQRRGWKHKSRKCAEVLVPHKVLPNMLLGAYVVDEAARARLNQTGFTLTVIVDADFFFR